MTATVAEGVLSTLKASGVLRVYGLPGDSLNGFTDALRRAGEITWEHVRHEEAAGFAAAAEAALTGELAVCAGPRQQVVCDLTSALIGPRVVPAWCRRGFISGRGSSWATRASSM